MLLLTPPTFWYGCFHWLHDLADTTHPLGWVLLKRHYPAGIHLSMLKSQKVGFQCLFASFHPSFISSIFIPPFEQKNIFYNSPPSLNPMELDTLANNSVKLIHKVKFSNQQEGYICSDLPIPEECNWCRSKMP